MAQYQDFQIFLTDNQKKKIAQSLVKKEGTTIRISKNHLQGNDKVSLTKRQISKLMKAKKPTKVLI